VVALADDTTSMYTSVGGGVIGAGHHAPVAEATHGLLRIAASRASGFAEPDDDETLPDRGWVRLHVLTTSGRRRCDVPAGAFWGREDHALMPVIAAAQEVITRIGEVSPA
jgi:hypothetical protein